MGRQGCSVPPPLLLLPLDLWERIAAAAHKPCPSPPIPPPPTNPSQKAVGPRRAAIYGGSAMGVQRCVPQFPHRLLGKTPNSQLGRGWDVLGCAGQSWGGSGQNWLGAPAESPQMPCRGIRNTDIKLKILILRYYPKNRKELIMTAPP